MLRYCPNKALPSYRFIPGMNAHPLKEGGHMFNEQEPSLNPLDEENYRQHCDFHYAIDLVNERYYWESHVYFEAIWNALNRQGKIARLCQALIKVGAFGVKYKQGDFTPALSHLKRSQEILMPLSEVTVGIDIKVLKEDLTLLVTHMLSEPSKALPKLEIKLSL